ncbi:WD repeat-containing protein 91 [Araneus ventricosus]|uniref:WD repeat-containing protein 91 n=1 Tax=Araneus ventricosus TaxID=182803 RepID=A0A4Y2T046_ARAVE|nr:WD repeat-containing protein 91 [Araneus ventricosus]
MLYGGTTGMVRLYDTKERRVVKEICTESSSSNNQRVLCICCSPLGTNFVTSTSIGEGGQLCLWDMKTLTMERQLLPKSDKACVHCCSFNHNGQLLLIGSSDGTSSILDLRTSEIFATWPSHSGGVVSTEFSSDETACYTLGADKKFTSWSANRTGQKLCDLDIHCDFSDPISTYGKRFCFNSDASHVLTCGPLGGVIYKIGNSHVPPVLDIWSTTSQ